MEIIDLKQVKPIIIIVMFNKIVNIINTLIVKLVNDSNSAFIGKSVLSANFREIKKGINLQFIADLRI